MNNDFLEEFVKQIEELLKTLDKKIMLKIVVVLI